MDLTRYFTGAQIQLRPGMVLAIYEDDGPSGICGQSMDITCPHLYIHTFENEEAFRKESTNLGRSGRKARVRYCVLGSHATGVMRLHQHKEEPHDQHGHEPV